MTECISKQTFGVYDARTPMLLGSQVQWTEGKNEYFTKNYLKLAKKLNTKIFHQFNSIIRERDAIFLYETHQGYYWTGSKSISPYYSCYTREQCTIHISKTYYSWLERDYISNVNLYVDSSPKFQYSARTISLSFVGPVEIQMYFNVLKWCVKKKRYHLRTLNTLPSFYDHETLLSINATHEQGILSFTQRELPYDMGTF